jgi:hypothetical protein
MRLPLLLLLGSLTAAAQIPPPILRIIRNPNPQNDRPYAQASAAIEVFGMHSVTGVGETWLIEQHSTFQSIEDLDRSLRGTGGDPSNWVDPRGATTDETLGPARALIAYYSDGLGYHSEDAVRMLPRARYFNVSVYRLGSDDSLIEAALKSRHARLDSMNLNQPELVYKVISGAPSGVYLVLSPMASLRAMDERVSKMPLEMETSSSSNKIARENLMFRVDPAISYVSDEFAAADRRFWRGQ